MQLTEKQKDIIRKIIGDLEVKSFITLGGYAGTGKTTCIKTISDALSRKRLNFHPCAFTGKASNVMRQKGVNATTIHSAIYKPTVRVEDGVEQTEWILKGEAELGQIDGFIVDEASMVSKEIHEDLISYGMPVLYVGDHGQLEPVGSKFNLMADPMYKLEEVHRNAGEIAHFAQHLRHGKPSTSFECGQKVQVVKSSAIEDRHLGMVDQTIVAFNKTRVSTNERVRKHLNIEYTNIAIGERIICLRNNRKLGLFNGMQGVVTRVSSVKEKIDFVANGEKYFNIDYDSSQFGQEKNNFKFNQKENPFDYAYAITCHKAQGDEFDSVIVMEQICSEWDHRKWAYTAASRARESLLWSATPRFIPAYLK